MQLKSIVIVVYALIILIGGLMGYLKAGSVASIIASSIFACALFVSAYFVRLGNTKAYNFSIFLILCLLAFFGYRFSQSFQIMPAGVMTLLSCLTSLYLIIAKPVPGQVR